jgi:hypothetical protein
MKHLPRLLFAANLALLASTPTNAGLLDKAKAVKSSINAAAEQPVKVSIGKGSLMDNRDDMLKVVAAFKKKIGASPLRIYGMKITRTNQIVVTYQSRYSPEKLETLAFNNGEIQGKPTPFRLFGNNVKVADNVFDLDQVKLESISDLVKMAREKTAQATKSNTLGATVNVVQSREAGRPVRIVVNVSADDRSALENVGEALESLKSDKVAKGSSVGQLIADANGKVIEFRLK